MKRIHVAFAIILLLCVAWIAASRYASVIPTTREGAIAALDYICDWAKWMAGIQTAALAVLVFVVFEKDSVQVRRLPSGVPFFSLTAFLALGSALFCSAWILSALASQAIRVHALSLPQGTVLSASYDVYETPLFGWTTRITLGYLLSLAHWLWGVGLAGLGLAVGTLLFAGRRDAMPGVRGG